MKNKIKVRFAPSPTGPLHIGSARTALFNFLVAKKSGGTIILRIDDTDKERSKKEFEDNIYDGLAWLGITFDETYKQSERGPIYAEAIQKMIDNGTAYVSKEENIKEGGRDEVIRFKNPNKEITFNDVVRGAVTFNTTDLGDFVIAKDLDTPLYHLTSVVDDIGMAITHIIRGEDHISNTPRQILLIEALGGSLPIYAHIPLILAPDRSKLSKRHGATSVTTYREMGYLPEAFINFIALLGWSPQAKSETSEGSDEEVLEIETLVEKFTLENIKKGGAIFNIEKLNWFNRQHLLKKSPAKVYEKIKSYLPADTNEEIVKKILPLILERTNILSDVQKIVASELNFFFDRPVVTKELIKNQTFLPELIENIEKIDEAKFSPEEVKMVVWELALARGKSEVLWPMRTALTGQERSPDPFTVASFLGKAETLARLKQAQNL